MQALSDYNMVTSNDQSPWLKISIITPNFNYGHFLEATLRSVIDQGYPNLEYIVLDDGSTDQSVSIIERYSDRLAHWQTGPNIGQYKTITEGLNRATGEVLGWINSDDMQMPWTLKAVGSIFSKFPEIDWVSTLRPAQWDYTGICYQVGDIPGFSREAYLDGLYNGYFGFIQQESTFWRRSLWLKAGGYVSHKYGPAGDFDLWSRFYEHAELIGIGIPLSGFRVQFAQQTSDGERYIKNCQKSLTDFRVRAKWRGTLWTRQAARAVGLRSIPRARLWAADAFGYTGKRIWRTDVGTPNPEWTSAITYHFL